MKSEEKFSLQKRIKSFIYAFAGLKVLFKDEHNARIHLIGAIGAIILGIWLNISSTEWICIVFAISLVISLEAVNSAIENLADFASPEKHELIKKTKDLAASAVLIVAFGSLLVGIIIFLPKVITLCLNN